MIRKAMLLLLCLCALISCASAEDELLIIHATDMHFLSPQLTDYGEAFMEIVRAADGKVTHYTPELMQAFVSDMLTLKPDAVILSGDLTLNGAEESHRELAEILLPLKQAGIAVLVLPGNHDTGTDAYRFGVDGAEVIAGTEDERFDDLYAGFGYDEAISRDSASMSYLAGISENVWCLLIDVNANGTYGTVQKDTLAWAEEQLIRAGEENKTVIAVTHQSLLQHSRLFSFGYMINNSTSLLDLFETYQVRLNLSGHLHMQHIAHSGSVTEIAGSSLAVSPNQYGVIRMEGSRLLDYSTQPVDVAAWAKENGQTNPDLLQFASYSAAFFDQTSLGQPEEMLAALGIDEAEIEQMTELAVRLNREYFAGARKASEADQAIELWHKHLPDQFLTRYLQSILDEPAALMNQFVFGQ